MGRRPRAPQAQERLGRFGEEFGEAFRRATETGPELSKFALAEAIASRVTVAGSPALAKRQVYRWLTGEALPTSEALETVSTWARQDKDLKGAGASELLATLEGLEGPTVAERGTEREGESKDWSLPVRSTPCPPGAIRTRGLGAVPWSRPRWAEDLVEAVGDLTREAGADQPLDVFVEAGPADDWLADSIWEGLRRGGEAPPSGPPPVLARLDLGKDPKLKGPRSAVVYPLAWDWLREALRHAEIRGGRRPNVETAEDALKEGRLVVVLQNDAEGLETCRLRWPALIKGGGGPRRLVSLFTSPEGQTPSEVDRLRKGATTHWVVPRPVDLEALEGAINRRFEARGARFRRRPQVRLRGNCPALRNPVLADLALKLAQEGLLCPASFASQPLLLACLLAEGLIKESGDSLGQLYTRAKVAFHNVALVRWLRHEAESDLIVRKVRGLLRPYRLDLEETASRPNLELAQALRRLRLLGESQTGPGPELRKGLATLGRFLGADSTDLDVRSWMAWSDPGPKSLAIAHEIKAPDPLRKTPAKKTKRELERRGAERAALALRQRIVEEKSKETLEAALKEARSADLPNEPCGAGLTPSLRAARFLSNFLREWRDARGPGAFVASGQDKKDLAQEGRELRDQVLNALEDQVASFGKDDPKRFDREFAAAKLAAALIDGTELEKRLAGVNGSEAGRPGDLNKALFYAEVVSCLLESPPTSLNRLRIKKAHRVFLEALRWLSARPDDDEDARQARYHVTKAMIDAFEAIGGASIELLRDFRHAIGGAATIGRAKGDGAKGHAVERALVLGRALSKLDWARPAITASFFEGGPANVQQSADLLILEALEELLELGPPPGPLGGSLFDKVEWLFNRAPSRTHAHFFGVLQALGPWLAPDWRRQLTSTVVSALSHGPQGPKIGPAAALRALKWLVEEVRLGSAGANVEALLAQLSADFPKEALQGEACHDVFERIEEVRDELGRPQSWSRAE